MTNAALPTFWRYAPGGVLSQDGEWQVTGRDRYSYVLRHAGEIAVIPCEHFESGGRPGVEFALPDRIEFRGAMGTRLGSPEETRQVRDVLRAAMPLMDRPLVSFASTATA